MSLIPESVSRTAAGVSDLLFPVFCKLCGDWVDTADFDAPICKHELHSLPRLEPPFCFYCSKPLNETDPTLPPDAVQCGQCRRSRQPLERTLAGFIHKGLLANIISDWKFSSAETWGPWLGDKLYHRLREPLNTISVDAITPVPMHPRRHRDRGFNQAKQLATALADRMELPFINLLKKTRHTPPQSSLNRDKRLNNLDGAFKIQSRKDEYDIHHILLVDDIYTTGSTLTVCADTLLDRFDIRLTGVVLARAT